MAIDTHTDPLSLAFAALADPTRRAILARLASGDADVSELMKPFPLSQPTISKHGPGPSTSRNGGIRAVCSSPFAKSTYAQTGHFDGSIVPTVGNTRLQALTAKSRRPSGSYSRCARCR